MIFLQATERDYLRATKQSVKTRGNRTTTGAKFLCSEKYNTNGTKK